MTYQFSKLFSNKYLLTLVLLVFLASCMFIQIYPTFDAYFIADDFEWLQFAKYDNDLLSASFHPSVGDWTTPVPNVIFWIFFRAFGIDPHGYYAANTLIHLLNSWLVFSLVRLVTKRVEVAFSSASIFALHFIHFSDWGALVWISAFVQLVVATFYLLTLVFFVQYLYFKVRYSFWVALVCFCLALASKETAVTLPLLLSAWYVFGLPTPERRLKEFAILLGPFWAVLGLYLLYKLLIQQTSDRYFEIGLYGFGIHLISNWKYFSNLVMPNPQSPPVQSFLLNSFPSWTLLLANLAAILSRLGLLVASITLWWRASNHVRLWVALSVITYLPFIGFVGGHAGANRYFYLPSIGFSTMLAIGIWWIFSRGSKRMATAALKFSLTIIVLGFWLFSLLPIRAWQNKMQANSQPLQQTIYFVDEYIAEREMPIERIYMIDFPSNRVRDLRKAIQLLYDADTVFVDSEHIDEIDLSIDDLTLTYDINQVVIRRP